MGTILHEGYCRQHISFLQSRKSVFIQKSEMPLTSHCAIFPDGYWKTLFKEEKKRRNHTKLSHGVNGEGDNVVNSRISSIHINQTE
ncbi:hypothetical protein AVEN_133468-1 [Araneus ventricosus]|uniref:Uncharacterized protein n=1 Tax=Araneus ventricosus TaxID=182803 RepID=A0A4Y2E8R9_ARAVE|nr:hypothetical protein AVEN_133468-1 [Araneus ventricosus]